MTPVTDALLDEMETIYYDAHADAHTAGDGAQAHRIALRAVIDHVLNAREPVTAPDYERGAEVSHVDE